MKALKIVLITLLIIIVLIGTSYLILTSLAKSDPNAGKYNTAPSTTLITKSLQSSLTNKEVELSNQEINEFLSYCVNEGTLIFENHSDIVINTINATIKSENNIILLYVAYNYKGTDYGLTSKIDLTFDSATQQFILIPKDLKIGQLKIPTNFAMLLIKDRLPAHIDLRNNALYIDYSALSTHNKNKQTFTTIESFRLSAGKAYIKLPAVTDSTVNYLKNLIEQGLQHGEEYIGEIFNNISNYFTVNPS